MTCTRRQTYTEHLMAKKVLVRKFCTACNGRGKIYAGREEFECAFCGGKGYVEEEVEVEDDNHKKSKSARHVYPALW